MSPSPVHLTMEGGGDGFYRVLLLWLSDWADSLVILVSFLSFFPFFFLGWPCQTLLIFFYWEMWLETNPR